MKLNLGKKIKRHKGKTLVALILSSMVLFGCNGQNPSSDKPTQKTETKVVIEDLETTKLYEEIVAKAEKVIIAATEEKAIKDIEDPKIRVAAFDYVLRYLTGYGERAVEIQDRKEYDKGELQSILNRLDTLDMLISALHSAKREPEREAEYWFRKGNANYILGNYDEALECYNKVLEIRPNNPEVLYNCARTYAHLEGKVLGIQE